MASTEAQTSEGSKRLACAIAAAALTFLIWATSPLLFAAIEPWDTPYPFYSISTFLGGAVLGYWFRGALVPSFLGAWLGQIVALLTLPDHDRTWFALGVATTAVGSLLVVAGAGVGLLLRRRAAV